MSLEHVSHPSPAKLAVSVFILVLVAFVVETQLTQYVQTVLGYRKPYFILYLVHSSFIVTLPLHLLYLRWTSNQTTDSFLKIVIASILDQLSPVQSRTFPIQRFSVMIFILTLGLTVPSLLWFVAVPLASISDVTAIWNANAFFAYLLALKFLDQKWEWRPLSAVILATIGVMIMIYGDTSDIPTASSDPIIPPTPLVGDLLTLAASILYALYQVLYKKYIALCTVPSGAAGGHYEPLIGTATLPVHDITTTESVPFGLHANFITSAVGICTFSLLWIPLPILHVLGLEVFLFPTDFATCLVLTGIALSGVSFSAGFMILLGIWGPIVASVGNLLTIVLVFLSDIIFRGGFTVLTLSSVVGSVMIISAFGILTYDMLVGLRIPLLGWTHAHIIE